MEGYEKRGYLNSDFRLFHLTDTKRQDFEYHYHEFDKIIIFIQGNVTYKIEGRTYQLQPYDIVLVSHSDIHKPIIDPEVKYERIIVYLSPGFINSYKTEEYDLSICFQKAKEQSSDVLRIHAPQKSSLYKSISDLEYACTHDGYAKDLYCKVVFLQFIIQLNRAALTGRVDYLPSDSSDHRIQTIMSYISNHLTEDLSIDSIAAGCYISRYHLMRIFKEATGYTLGAYITEKRLILAKDKIANGATVLEACMDSGFRNYSTFSRAYKKYFQNTASSTD